MDRWPFLLTAALLSHKAWAEPASDPWLGRDKALHFAATTAISGGGYGLSALATENRWIRVGVGFGAAVAVGALKEGYDAAGKGDPSWKDMTWNVVGAATGTLIAWGIDRLLSHRPPPRSTSSIARPRSPILELTLRTYPMPPLPAGRRLHHQLLSALQSPLSEQQPPRHRQ